MFWGLNLKPNRKYTQTTSKSFHISQAALDTESAQDGANQIFISCENQKFLVCTLHKGGTEQVMLDYNFAEGDEICFQSLGTGNVTLSGYLVVEDPMDFMNGGDDEEEEEEESEVEIEDLRNVLNKKPKAKKGGADKAAAKVAAAGDDEDDEDEEDSDFDEETAGAEGAEASEEETDDNVDSEDDEEDEENDDEDESEDDDDEEVQQPKAKQPKLEKAQKQQNGVAAKAKVAAATAAPEGKKGKKDKKENQQQQQKQPQQQQQQKAAGGERTITGGVKVEDVRVGNGPEAKTGKRAQVYYEGRLKTNNKVFDSLKQGAGFKFGLGRGEVIKGWDVGVVGMKVGGKRRITCPAHMAYGAKGAPPSIPPNSTLVFEVELKGVN